MTGLAERPGIAAPDRHEAATRILDVTFSLSLIILVAPLLLLLWVLVRATSEGPTVFRQERVGRDRRTFTLLKLRTMYTGNDDRIHREYVASLLAGDQAELHQAELHQAELHQAGPHQAGPHQAGPHQAGPHQTVPQPRRGLFKLDDDPRVTLVGSWLRRTSLDELPQLINVLRGEMSLVGPRPVLPWEAQLFDPPFQRRFAVKPGITGLWQVSGRSKLSMRRALELDVEYVIRRSLALDLTILLRTVPALFRGGAR